VLVTMVKCISKNTNSILDTCTAGQCQQDEQEGRTTPPDRKPKSSKGKPVRGAGKATTKPKPRAKVTPAPPSAVNQGPVHLTQVWLKTFIIIRERMPLFCVFIVFKLPST
jgi:hypothetical protein